MEPVGIGIGTGSTPDLIPDGKEGDESRPLLPNTTNAKKAHAFSKAAILIYISTMSSRYALCGIQAILPLFLRNILVYSETGASIIYQLLDGFANFLPLFLSIFSDSIFGKYRSTVYFSVIFTFGTVAISVGALPLNSVPIEKLLMILAIVMVSIGQAGVCSSQAPFGGDQFILPQQQKQMDTFFATFYFMYNVASALAKCFTPVLRSDVHCFGQTTCYSLGFAVPVFVIALGTAIFALGRKHYIMKPVSASIISKSFKSVVFAIGSRNGTNTEHWLDKASEKFGHEFVNDLKRLIRLMLVFIPVVIFWALWSQQGSTWTFQATRMSGYVTQNFSILPDQVQMTSSVLLLIFIPIFERVIYPYLSKLGLFTKPLQRIGVGFVLLAFSFAAAGSLELILQKTYPVLPGIDETTLNVINPLPCSMNVTLNPIFLEKNSGVPNISVSSYNSIILPYQNVLFQNILAVDYKLSATMNPCDGQRSKNFASLEYLTSPGTVHTFVINESTVNRITTGTIISSVTNEDLTKSNKGNAKLRILGINLPTNLKSLAVKLISNSANYTFYLSPEDSETISTEVDPERYLVTISFHRMTTSKETVSQSLGILELDQGGSYLLLIDGNINQTFTSLDYVLTPPNSIHMVWQLPQYFLLTIAEVLVGITGYQFAYAQAPNSMKSLVCSFWLCLSGMGAFVVALVLLFPFPNQAATFFFFTILMVFGTIWFAIAARRYETQIRAEISSLPNSPASSSRRSSHNRSRSGIPRSNSVPALVT